MFPASLNQKSMGFLQALPTKWSKLHVAATRGDGKVGDDITAQVIGSDCVPTAIADAPDGILEIRGEIYLPHAAFAAINTDLIVGKIVPAD